MGEAVVRIVSFIIILFIIIFGITFAILNAEPVAVHYYLGIRKVPLSLIMAMTFSIGLLIGLLTTMLMVFKLKTERFHLNKRLKLAEKEIENLRTIPIKDEH